MSDFIISFNLFGEFDNFEDWDAAEEKERREYEKKKEKRHKEVTPEELNELENDKDEINTKKTTKWASTKEGGEYSVASLRSLRAGINRHLSDINIIIMRFLRRYRKSGKDTSFHHPHITESDLQRIRCSSALSPDTPVGLVRKVWFDIQLCFARRGRERSRELTMTSFIIQRDEHGVEYRINHKDPNDPHKENLRGFMFARPGDPLCPVKSFKKYISKCPPDAKSFYLHLKRSITVASDGCPLPGEHAEKNQRRGLYTSYILIIMWVCRGFTSTTAFGAQLLVVSLTGNSPDHVGDGALLLTGLRQYRTGENGANFKSPSIKCHDDGYANIKFYN
ncbi:hypothetical protein N1851_018401 [Merluccius polli]|uniref:Uncharacterized protein n=1 Tax=Merluccius polli TaxID=89951 RepID=A0AA47MND5_MERPO|nr:hypothetical protein N1851_018401 [Merluccius polli]